jgi:hypothetical protein
VVSHICGPADPRGGGRRIDRENSKPAWDISETHLKNTKQNKKTSKEKEIMLCEFQINKNEKTNKQTNKLKRGI